MKNESLFIVSKLLPADEVLQRYARNLRAPALNYAQDDAIMWESNKYEKAIM
jgi:hypothetical protein